MHMLYITHRIERNIHLQEEIALKLVKKARLVHPRSTRSGYGADRCTCDSVAVADALARDNS